ncbi:transposase [Burkholderia pseudomallei]|uniref:transposase n=4 Tax=Burkholderia pseudomallei TaxID=28450 RepID=UPI001E59F6BA|nr:transposase [Burkholderia pseudomallei]
MVAAVSDPKDFRNGRHFAAWLGLVPRQSSSGDRTHLLGISKRGDRHLRTLLIHGARAVLTCLISSGHFNLGERPRLLQLNNTAA